MDMTLLHDHEQTRPRDAGEERRERQRYWLLAGVLERTGGDGGVPVHALEIGQAISLSREETFRLVQFLAQHEYLHYVGAGPRVHITQKGIEYLTREARRRRSIRPG